MGNNTTVRYFLDMNLFPEINLKLWEMVSSQAAPDFDKKAASAEFDKFLRKHRLFHQFQRNEIKIDLGHRYPLQIVPQNASTSVEYTCINEDERVYRYQRTQPDVASLTRLIRVAVDLPLPPGETRQFGKYSYNHATAMVLWNTETQAYRIFIEGKYLDDINRLFHDLVFGLIEPDPVESKTNPPTPDEDKSTTPIPLILRERELKQPGDPDDHTP